MWRCARWLLLSTSCGRIGFGVTTDDGAPGPTVIAPNSRYHKQITIDHTKVAGNLTEFPVLFATTDGDLAANANDDIRFFAADGTTELPADVESYDAASGALLAWFEAPALSSTEDTVLYMGYADIAARGFPNSANVWSNAYAGVWHLNEDPAGFAPQIHDATSNTDNGTTTGNMTAADQVPGVIGGSVNFDGIDDTIGFGAAAPLEVGTSSFTLSMWVLVTSSVGQYDLPWNKGGAAPGACAGYDISLGTGVWVADATDAMTDYEGIFGMEGSFLGAWVYLTVAVDRPAATMTVYANGAATGQTAISSLGTLTNPTQPAEMGNENCGNDPFHGQLDEVHLANVARAPEWIATEHNNQSSPATFLSIGPQEAL